jgi:serine/threonine protein kinase
VAIEPGQHLLHYRIAAELGKGGMGEVCIAEDTKLHRRPEHPNIVTLHSVEQTDSSTGTTRRAAHRPGRPDRLIRPKRIHLV